MDIQSKIHPFSTPKGFSLLFTTFNSYFPLIKMVLMPFKLWYNTPLTISSYNDGSVLSTFLFFNSHSQTMITFHLIFVNSIPFSQSFKAVILIFSVHQSVLVFGIPKYLQLIRLLPDRRHLVTKT